MKIRSCILSVAASLIWSAIVTSQDVKKKTPCDAPEYFGICDTFVPGTRIAGRDRQPILVSSTWPGGPADRYGICAGDQIVSVNGVLSSENTFNRMLRELVSASPTLVSLKVLRGNENLEFSVPRVRESTLAYLSNQKFLREQLVPLEQTAEGMDEIERFRDRALAAVGYRSAGTEFVPLNTPDTQVQRFIDLLESISAPERIPTPSLSPVTTRIFENREGFSAGFAALVLKAPDEVWIRTVIPVSPAQKAGLFPGDQLIELDGKPVKGMKKEDLEKHILQPDVPRAIVLKLMRGRRVSKIVIRTQKFREFEPHVGFPQTLPSAQPSDGSDLILGLSVLHAENPSEAVVNSISYPSPAFEGKLLIGDKLIRVNGNAMESVSRDQLEQVLRPVQTTEIVLEISRAGKQMTFHISPVTYESALAKIHRKLTRMGSTPYHCPGGNEFQSRY